MTTHQPRDRQHLPCDFGEFLSWQTKGEDINLRAIWLGTRRDYAVIGRLFARVLRGGLRMRVQDSNVPASRKIVSSFVFCWQ